MHAPDVLVLLGLLLVVAFAAEETFKLLRIPPVLVLMACGYGIGPVAGIVEVDELLRFAPHFGALAFLLILFEGGLDLDLDRTIGAIFKAWKMSFGSFALAAAAGFAVASWTGFGAASALVVGIILAPISGAIVIPLVGRLAIAEELRSILVLEAAMADVLGVVGLSVVAQVIDAGGWRSLLAAGTVVGAVASAGAGAAAGLLWPRAMRLLGERRYVDVLTFGVVLTLWGAMTAVGASGALAVLALGLTLANEDALRARLGWSGVEEAREMGRAEGLHSFIAQLNFLVRAFFFVFIGALVRFVDAQRELWLLAAGVVVSYLVIRAFLVRRVLRAMVDRPGRAASALLVCMQPRGLVTAVLALEAQKLGLPGAEQFLTAGSIVIVATNVLMAFGLIGWGGTRASTGHAPRAAEPRS